MRVTTDERYQRGLARQSELGGGGPRAEVYEALAAVAPDLRRLAVEFAYGDIHARPGLSAGRRELVILGCLITLGATDPQIRAHTGSALAAGVTPGEVSEAILQALPYAGFPRVIAAMTAAAPVLLPPATEGTSA